MLIERSTFQDICPSENGDLLSTQSIYQFTTRKLASDLRMLLDVHLQSMSWVFAPQKPGEAFLVTLGVLFLD